MRDKCGPAGKGFFQKLLSAIVPDVIFGVELTECCKNHDKAWSKEGANKTADKAFRAEIQDKFYLKTPRKTWFSKVLPPAADEQLLFLLQLAWQALGFSVAWYYYVGVRFGGIFYKLGGE